METKIVLCREGESKASDEDKQVFQVEIISEKLLYICMHRPKYQSNGGFKFWIVADPHVDKPADFYCEKDLKNTSQDYPSEYLDLRGCGTVALGSKIYFIGGLLLSTRVVSDKIYVFDTLSNTWESEPCRMKQKRSYPEVLSYKNKIYIFGFQTRNLEEEYSLPSDQWSEVFDVNSRESYYLPAPPEEFTYPWFGTHPAIDYSQEKVYFCEPATYLYGYSFKDQEWFFVPPPRRFHPSLPILNWSTSVVVIGSVLFWHHYGTIYGYDLSDDFSNSVPVSMCSVPSSCEFFRSPLNHMSGPPPNFLVNAGNGILCLVHPKQHDLDEPLVRCHRFRVLYAPTPNQVEVTYLDTQTQPQEDDSNLLTVLELSCTGGERKKDEEKKKKKKKRKKKMANPII